MKIYFHDFFFGLELERVTRQVQARSNGAGPENHFTSLHKLMMSWDFSFWVATTDEAVAPWKVVREFHLQSAVPSIQRACRPGHKRSTAVCG